MPVRSIVFVSSGNVQECYADSANAEVQVIDFDNIKDELWKEFDLPETQVRKVEKEKHHVHGDDPLVEARFADWVKQAIPLPRERL